MLRDIIILLFRDVNAFTRALLGTGWRAQGSPLRMGPPPTSFCCLALERYCCIYLLTPFLFFLFVVVLHIYMHASCEGA